MTWIHLDSIKVIIKTNLKKHTLTSIYLNIFRAAVGKQKQKGGDTLLPFEVMVAIREGRVFYILTAAA